MPQPSPHNMGTNLGGLQIGQQNIINGPYPIFNSSGVPNNYDFKESKTRLQTILDWFSPVNFAQKQRDIYKHAYSGSKESFFQLDELIRWKRGDIQTLWCYGIRMKDPGALKVIYKLMRVVACL